MVEYTGKNHRFTHDLKMIMISSLYAEVPRECPLLLPLSELHNEPLLLLLLDLLGNDWVPHPNLGLHLAPHRLPAVVEVEAVVDLALGLQGCQLHLGCPYFGVRPAEEAK